MAKPFQRKIAQSARLAAQNAVSSRLLGRSFSSWNMAGLARLVDALFILGNLAFTSHAHLPSRSESGSLAKAHFLGNFKNHLLWWASGLLYGLLATGRQRIRNT